MDEQKIEDAINALFFQENRNIGFDDNDDVNDYHSIFKNENYIKEPQTKSYFVGEVNNNNLETTKTLNNNQNVSYSNTKTNILIYDDDKIEDIKIEISPKNKNKKKKRRRERNKINIIDEDKKKNMGRKTNKKGKEREKKNEIKNPSKKHDKNSKDNLIYKIKVRFQKFLYEHLNHLLKKKKKKGMFKRIDGNSTRNGSKEHNLKMFNLTIENFLLLQISEKYSLKNNTNINLIEELKNDEDCKNLFNMTYNECLYKYFLMDKTQFKNIFGYNNDFLYENMILEPDEKKNWEKIINHGFIEHFENISGRSTMTEKAKEIRKLMNQKKSNKGDLNNLDLNE